MSKALIKDTLRTIKNNFSRYISIMLIIALGTAFFVGIKATAPDMFATAEKYFTDYNLMDIRIQSLAGLTDEDIAAVKKLEGVQYVSGQKFTDALVRINGEIEADIDGTQISARAYSISPEYISEFLVGTNNGSYMNRPELIEGKYPSSVNECLVDASRLSTPESYKVGNTITLETESGNAPSTLNTNTFTIVGIIRSPYYLSFERGNTNVGSGKIGTFIIIPEEAFNMDYYSEIYVNVQGADYFDPYSDQYFEYIAPIITNIEAISANQMKIRAAALRPELQKSIAEGEALIQNSSSEVSEKLKDLDDTIAQLEELVNNGPQLLQDAEQEFNDKFSSAQGELSNNTAEYYAAIEEYSRQEELYKKNLDLYNTEDLKHTQAKNLYDSTYADYQSARSSLSFVQQTIKTTESLITAAEATLLRIGDIQTDAYSNEQIQSIINMMQLTYPELYNAVKSLTTQGLATEIAASLQPYLDSQKANLARQQKELDEKNAALDTLGEQLAAKEKELTQATLDLANAKTQLDQAASDLQSASAQLTSYGYNIQSSNLQLQIEKIQAEAKLNELRNQVTNAPMNLAQAKEQRASAMTQLDAGLRSAQEELSSAKSLFGKLDKISWSIYDRNDTPGYQSYGQTVNNIEVLSNIFPIFFFILSSMICLTTLTRLVEEDRVLIGTYKALGYTQISIVAKYVIYSLSACFIGTALGIGVAVFLLPFIINSAYSVMYSLPGLIYVFPWWHSLLSLLISVLCTAFATTLAIFRELQTNPSVLMRPKAPKVGKRILLEKVPLIWEKLSFTAKVTARNLFRNKQRFTMTLFGIAGCTALLIASLGMHNSISAILTKQYGDNAISKYDFQIVFNTTQTTSTHTYEFNEAAGDARISSLMLTAMKSMVGSSERSDKTLDVYVLVPEKSASLSEYIDLRNRKTGEKYILDDTGAIITEKLAADTKTNVGEQIQFTDGEGNTYSVTVSAIAENYTFHYIYMTEKTYKDTTGEAPQFNYAVGNLSSTFDDADQETLANAKGLISTDLMKTDGITAVAFTSDTTESISQITDALSLVILLFFVSALILAFVVLYNLSNINIIERTREIATLKVLGFVDNEVSSYIYRENIFVSLFGILFGVALGILLHYLLISFTAIDTVMYGQNIAWYSFLIAIVITGIIIVFVNLLLHRKLKKVEMVLSLKSVE
ncbi:MAG: FtsX-like permease family protein [Clostridia bacterium]|nr:FtsX-like permease family protein [Clostridia bacterium]